MYSEGESWLWALALIGMTVTIHAIGVVSIALGFSRLPRRLMQRHLPLRRLMPVVIVVIAVIGLLLTALHGIEAATWATAYVALGAVDTAPTAMLFSLGAMTTVGAPGLALPPQWQLMGVLEAANGALLFGISTAYIFVVMQAYWPLFHPRD